MGKKLLLILSAACSILILFFFFKLNDNIKNERADIDEKKMNDVACDFLGNIFTSQNDRYTRYKVCSNKQFEPFDMNSNFLNENCSSEYLELYKNTCTINCLEVMENLSLFTYVDYLADVSQKVVTVCDVKLVPIEENTEKQTDKMKSTFREYYYTVTIVTNPEDSNEMFDIQGRICFAKKNNEWKVTYVDLSDYGVLSVYITGENILRMQ